MSGHYGRRRGTTRTGGSRWMNLRYAGRCKVCGVVIPAGTNAFYDASARTVTHSTIECAEKDGLTTLVWRGSPLSGSMVPELMARRVGSGYVSDDPWAKTRSRGYYGRDAGRCEDAPCCGCCFD